DGKLVGNDAEFHAVFQVYCPSDEPARLVLPLGGAGFRLVPGSVLLDGARALPVPAQSPRPGFTLKVAGKGRHKVELAFLAPVTEAAPERQVQFTAPKLVQHQLRFAV